MLSVKWVRRGLLQRAESRSEFIGDTDRCDLGGDPQLTIYERWAERAWEVQIERITPGAEI